MDIGADEFVGVGLLTNTCAGNIDLDADVDGADLAVAADPAVIAADFGRTNCLQ